MCNVPVRRSENTLDDSPLWHFVTASRTNVGNRTTESSQVNPSGIQSLSMFEITRARFYRRFLRARTRVQVTYRGALRGAIYFLKSVYGVIKT